MGRKKRWGQHFLRDKNVVGKIIDLIDPQEEETILEIGAGKGALTIPLSALCGRLIAVEKDRELADFLRRKNLKNVKIIEADILSVNLREIVENEIKVAGNLPYYISSRIIDWFIRQRELVKNGVFMLQKEVAERICAKPGSKSYSSLSIHTQIFFEAKIHFHVSPRSFSPPPEVISSIIELKKRDKPLVEIDNEQGFVEFLKSSFAKRRKTLLNNLILMGFEKEKLFKIFDSLSIEPKKRAEEIGIEKFYDLWISLKNS